MHLKYLAHKELKNFPSGSALEFYSNRLYVVGDDARQLLVLNKNWKELHRISLFDHKEYRIPKNEKADLEASTMITDHQHPKLLLLGSGSFENKRNKSFLVDMKTETLEEKDFSIFYDRIKSEGISEINIEAAAVVNDYVLLCNRGNLTNRTNHFIITRTSFRDDQKNVFLLVLPFVLPVNNSSVVGISGLTYSFTNNWLIFTASTEVTDSAYKDGEIGESYCGIIENADGKIIAIDKKEDVKKSPLQIDHFIALSPLDNSLRKKKIESVCIEKDRKRKLKLHLVADNDTGVSYLFKVELKK